MSLEQKSIKKEDLNHTGAHKVNNVIAQGLLAKKNGKNKSNSWNRSWATWSCNCNNYAALLGLECTVFMGAKDVQRQELNVFRMNFKCKKSCCSRKWKQKL